MRDQLTLSDVELLRSLISLFASSSNIEMYKVDIRTCITYSAGVLLMSRPAVKPVWAQQSKAETLSSSVTLHSTEFVYYVPNMV